ncbi:MAG: hypothetical protein P9X24_01490 [Candidatus Hatepunaea meridiana]|nr:hypothetical protein [Candidatus Hatepunaea meridiana]
MKLLKILSKINLNEKSSFVKILDGFCAESRDITPLIDQILTQSANQLKKADDDDVVKLFNILKDKYIKNLENRIKYSNYQLDIIIEIFVRDGNQMMTKEWFSKLYNNSSKNLISKSEHISSQIKQDKTDLPLQRIRDYLIYQDCVKTAYENDKIRNREEHISWEEKTLLCNLSKNLELSIEEERAIAYSVIRFEKHNIDDIIGELKDAGIIFFNRKTNSLLIPDEIVWILRDLLKIEISNKYLRRILRHLRDAEINLIARKHNIDRKKSRNNKIKDILIQGINVTNLLVSDIFNDKVTKADRGKRVQELISKDLEIDLPKSGRSLEEKVSILVCYFNELERDYSSALSKDGYEKLLSQLKDSFNDMNKRIKDEFELQDEDVMSSELLEDYNIVPRDVIYLLKRDELVEYCKNNNIKSRGNLVSNIINNYRNIQDIYLENFELVGKRDFHALKDKGLLEKESELGLLYEKLVKDIFRKLGFNVDERLRKEINNDRTQIDERQLFFPVSDNYNSRFILLPVALFRWANGMKP